MPRARQRESLKELSSRGWLLPRRRIELYGNPPMSVLRECQRSLLLGTWRRTLSEVSASADDVKAIDNPAASAATEMVVAVERMSMDDPPVSPVT